MRKRIIRILRDIVERQPTFKHNAEIVAKIIRRSSDEEGVRKLVLETMYNLWFLPCANEEAMNTKVRRADNDAKPIVHAFEFADHASCRLC